MLGRRNRIASHDKKTACVELEERERVCMSLIRVCEHTHTHTQS